MKTSWLAIFIAATMATSPILAANVLGHKTPTTFKVSAIAVDLNGDKQLTALGVHTGNDGLLVRPATKLEVALGGDRILRGENKQAYIIESVADLQKSDKNRDHKIVVNGKGVETGMLLIGHNTKKGLVVSPLVDNSIHLINLESGKDHSISLQNKDGKTLITAKKIVIDEKKNAL